MGTQPEAATYDATVYSWETTDAVKGGVGGIANTPLLNLANRTGWLKAQVAALVTAIGKLAGLDSPSFTGSPTAPTQAAGDNTTLIATDAFVQAAINGLSVVPLGTGTATLTTAQAGVGIIRFTGATTGACTVIFPSQTGQWLVIDDTTGGFPVTIKTAAAAGTQTHPGAWLLVACDGTTLRTGGVRRLATSNVTLYVDGSKGSDSNLGFASGAAAFATIQQALNVAATQYDGGGYSLTISVAAGAYAAVAIQGYDLVGWSSVTVTSSGASITSTGTTSAFAVSFPVLVNLVGFTLAAGSSAAALQVTNNAMVQHSGCTFGAAGYQIFCGFGGYVSAIGAVTISGGGINHAYAYDGGAIRYYGQSVVFSSTPTYSSAFLLAQSLGDIQWISMTFTGSANGSRYNVSQNALISTNGAAVTSVPGSSVGATASGGQYL
ncbi:MAG: hypothetical protein ACRYHQ_24250 [Janthinobacterium lividum]